MKKLTLKKLCISIAVVLLVFIIIGIYYYKVKYAKSVILSSTSDDGQYELTVYEVGEPKLPFGSSHCTILLKNHSKKVSETQLTIQEDGCQPNRDNFLVFWKTDRVQIVVSGVEQDQVQYDLYYDGNVMKVDIGTNLASDNKDKNQNEDDVERGNNQEKKKTEDEGITPKEPDVDHSESNQATNEEINEVDYSEYFEDLVGCVVIYNAEKNIYDVYNEQMANIEESPYSTFKIISTLMGLRNNVLQDENSKMKYNNTKYSVDAWNHNLTLKEAFQSSCVWYFRQVIDAIGYDEVEKEVKELNYGNCDISEWKGSKSNTQADLNGFWLNSTLKISPMEQVRVLKAIFQNQSLYSEEEINTLKRIMLFDDINGYSIYGKTGTGPNNQGWYAGIAQKEDQDYYFAVYLYGEDSKRKASGNDARKILINILEDKES